MIKPLNNNVLVEIIDEFDGIIRNTDNEQVQKGIVRNFEPVAEHLTASAGHSIDYVAMENIAQNMRKLIGCTVYWEEYSDVGKKFEQDGKKYSLIPFYRLIGYEE